jgi:hypothetical protein
MVEHEAASSEAIEIGGLDNGVAVATELRPEVIDGDEKNVGTLGVVGPGKNC